MTRFITDAFESEFSQRLHVRDAIAVANGTAALWSLDLRREDEVITSPFTFVGTSNAILICGAKPVFADINCETLLIDQSAIADAVTARTKAILPVQQLGRMCNMDAINQIAQSRGIAVIEDAAQAFGTTQNGRFAGTFSDAGCFSFYKTKNLSTFEGGMIAVPENSRLSASKIRAITNQGDVGGKQYGYIGFNSRMPEPCSLIGLQHLKYCLGSFGQLLS